MQTKITLTLEQAKEIAAKMLFDSLNGPLTEEGIQLQSVDIEITLPEPNFGMSNPNVRHNNKIFCIKLIRDAIKDFTKRHDIYHDGGTPECNSLEYDKRFIEEVFDKY